MKTLKKSLFTIGLAFSMVLGVAFSFAPEDSAAQSSVLSGSQSISEEGDSLGARRCYTRTDGDGTKGGYLCNGNSTCKWELGYGTAWRRCN